MGADDLEDGLEYEFDAESNSDEQVISESSQIENIEQELEPPAKKQKRETPQKKMKSQSKELKRAKMEADMNHKKDLGKLEPAVIADFLASKLRKENKELSALEIQDQSVPQSDFVNTSKFEEARNLDTLPDFLEMFKLVSEHAFTLILSSSAQRVCDVIRALEKKHSRGGIAKLINKNKLSFDRKSLSTNPRVAVATPGRALRLIKEDILDPTHLGAVVVEGSYLDCKMSSVWDDERIIPLLSKLSRENACKVLVF